MHMWYVFILFLPKDYYYVSTNDIVCCIVCLGAYSVEVLYDMKPIWGSPFTCQVFDASRVSLDDCNAKQFNINQKIAVQGLLNFPSVCHFLNISFFRFIVYSQIVVSAASLLFVLYDGRYISEITCFY